MTDASQLRLGRKPGVIHDARTLRLSNYLISGLPTPPRASRVTRALGPDNWQMFANDRYGDCTAAAAGHLTQAWEARVKRSLTPTEAGVLKLYSDVTGFDPATGANDNGAYLLDVLNAWRKEGLNGDRPSAFLKIDPRNHNQVKLGTYLFGGIYTGALLPLSAQNLGGVWKPSSGADGVPGSWGGHAFNVVAYGNYVTIVTWGQEQVLSWDWWDKYVDEVYIVLSPDWFKISTNKSPQGFNVAQLQADLDTISSGKGVKTISADPVTRVVEEGPGAVRAAEDVAAGKPGAVQEAEREFDRLQPLVQPAVQEAKAGYKTTEFWLTLVGAVLTQVGALSLPGKYGQTITTVALVVAYALSRGIAKAGTPNIPPSHE